MDYPSSRPALFVATDLLPQSNHGGSGFDTNSMNHNGLADNTGPGGAHEGTDDSDTRQRSYPPPINSDQLPAHQWVPPRGPQHQNVSNNAATILHDSSWLFTTEALYNSGSNQFSTHTSRPRSRTAPSRFSPYLRCHPYRRPPRDGAVVSGNGSKDTQDDRYSKLLPPPAVLRSDSSSYWPPPDCGHPPGNGSIDSPPHTYNRLNGSSGTINHNISFDFAPASPVEYHPGSQSQPSNGGLFTATDSRSRPQPISIQVNEIAQLIKTCQLDNQNASNTTHIEENVHNYNLSIDPQLLDSASGRVSSYNQGTFGPFSPEDMTGYPSTGRNPWLPERAAQMMAAASPETPWSEVLRTPVDSPRRAKAGLGNDALSHNSCQTPGAPQVYELHSASEGYLNYFFPQVAKSSVREASKNRRRSDARLYPCELCGQTLTARHNLKFHINSHFGIKNHKCTYCDASFNTPSDRKRHEKTCAQNGNPAPAAPPLEKLNIC